VWNRSSVFGRGSYFDVKYVHCFFLLCHTCVVCLVFVMHIWNLVYWPLLLGYAL
jgi:hypothetical protein